MGEQYKTLEIHKKLPLNPADASLAGTVGSVGLLALLRQAWKIALPCLGLVILGLFVAERRFDREGTCDEVNGESQ